MSEMVDRVARASAFARRSRHDQARDADHYWQYLGDLMQQDELTAARAAIEAMRDCDLSREIMSKGWLELRRTGPDHEAIRRAWRAMIDTALKD